jgi:hypothetical protein
MIYVIGDKTTEELVKQTANYTSAPPINQILANESDRVGVPVSGLYAYGIKDQAILQRLDARDSYDLVWSGVFDPQTSGTVNSIVDLDFSSENNKRWIQSLTDKEEIVADGADTATVTIRIIKADKSGIDTNVTTTQNVPIDTPDGPGEAKISITNGVGNLSLATTRHGYWTIPGSQTSRRYPNFRLLPSVEILALLNM